MEKEEVKAPAAVIVDPKYKRNKIILCSAEDEEIEVDQIVAEELLTVKYMLDDFKEMSQGGGGGEEEGSSAMHAIPIPNVTTKILKIVLDFCLRVVDENGFLIKPKLSEEDSTLCECEKGSSQKGSDPSSTPSIVPSRAALDFCKSLDRVTLFEVVLAANYLNTNYLLDTACATIADLIKDKTPQQIRDMLGIEDDFTPEEFEEALKENQWLEERPNKSFDTNKKIYS